MNKLAMQLSILSFASGVAFGALAQPRALDEANFRLLGPAAHHAVLEQQKREAESRGAPQRRVDQTGPELLTLNGGTSTNVASATSEIYATFTATDDLSGVRWLYAEATGEQGNIVTFYSFLSASDRSASGMLTADFPTAYLPPGKYTFTNAVIGDLADNRTEYTRTTLDKLGRSSFNVKNPGGFDISPPQLRSGKLLTPTLSLSGHVPGTDELPFARAVVRVRDRGDTAIAGILAASVQYCMPDRSNCIYLSGVPTSPQRDAPILLQVGTQLYPDWDPPGTYYLTYVSLVDKARNEQYLLSKDFGGTVDFGEYFDSTTITITP